MKKHSIIKVATILIGVFQILFSLLFIFLLPLTEMYADPVINSDANRMRGYIISTLSIVNGICAIFFGSQVSKGKYVKLAIITLIIGLVFILLSLSPR